ncbi:hypothetical protein K7X08_012689 [Anisodus acutangulus]|uniref:Uncharacterized protein n=1 Tax=Anisodus acutangulus TaxID=402998 RepID=A0A9Q1M9L0_9SOLA|nr:hypothetical protein K7X08_012689 [Anisodus acutangulus]
MKQDELSDEPMDMTQVRLHRIEEQNVQLAMKKSLIDNYPTLVPSVAVEDSVDYAVEGQSVHGVTAPESGGNKRPREAEDVNWDKRRRLKMLFYHVAEGLYLSQTKDPNYDKEETDTQSDEVTEVGQNPKLG